MKRVINVLGRSVGVVGFGAALLASGSCSKTVAFQLELVEPCDQKDQALNGVSSFVVSSHGSQADDVVTFNVDGGAAGAPLAVGLGDAVTVTVQAFAGDVTAGGASAALPQSIGRTMPLAITEQSQDQNTLVLVGKVDSFGKTTDAEGQCTSMTAGAEGAGLVAGRHGHTATFVPKLNKVLIVGGAVWNEQQGESFLATAELYDPATGLFEELPEIGGARAYHAATALPDGRVLITGGLSVISGHVGTLATGLIFDPALGVNDPYKVIELKNARAHHTSTLMEGSGIIVIAGGCQGNTETDGCSSTAAGTTAGGLASTNLETIVETFDIAQPTGAATTKAVAAQNGFAKGRAFHQATALENGPDTILVVTGGADANGPVCDVEIFRASGGALAHIAGAENLAGFLPGICPVRHAAVAIDQHRLVVIGGQTEAPGGAPSGPGSPNVYFFFDAAGVDSQHPVKLFQEGGRFGAQAAELSDGSILVAGGSVTAGPNGAQPPPAEVLRPGVNANQVLTATVLAGPPLAQPRDHAALAILPGNEFLFTGGYDATARPFVTSSAAEIYFGP